jgi:hypothetical protein
VQPGFGWASGLLFLLLPASAPAEVVPDSFVELKQVVVEFQGGTRDDVLAADCRPGSQEPLTCPGADRGQTVPIPDSGWQIREACYAIFENYGLSLGFEQVGIVGDADGNGDPNTGSNVDGVDIPDDPVLGPRDLYSVLLDENLPSDSVDYEINLPLTNVGDYTPADFPDHARSEGRLCLIRAPGADPPVAGPADLGCVMPDDLGMYWAGTTGLSVEAPAGSGKQVSREVMYFVDDLKALPMTRSGDGILPKFIRMRSGSGADTCQEDAVSFLVVSPCVEMEKSASGECRGVIESGAEVASFGATFNIRNCGGVDLNNVMLEDKVLAPDGLEAPTCQLDGHSLPVQDMGDGSFRAQLGALPVGEYGEAVVHCRWPGTRFGSGHQLEFSNWATAIGMTGDTTTRDSDRAGAVALKNECTVVDGLMLKEHDGVGYDNAFSLTKSLPLPPPFDDRAQFGSAVNPGELADVDAEEDFIAEGAVPLASRPGTFHTVPRIIAPGFVRPGSRARFTWKILVSKGIPDNFAGVEVACSLCAELAQKRSPAHTFAELASYGRGRLADLVLGNRPLTMRVTQIGREPQHLRRFEADLDARGIPGLEQLVLRHDGQLAFMGCKPTVVLIDPFSNHRPLLRNDLIVVRIDVPETERARVYADPTSCEISYLHVPPQRE